MQSHFLIFRNQGAWHLFEEYGSTAIDTAREVGAKLAELFSEVAIDTRTDGVITANERIYPAR